MKIWIQPSLENNYSVGHIHVVHKLLKNISSCCLRVRARWRCIIWKHWQKPFWSLNSLKKEEWPLLRSYIKVQFKQTLEFRFINMKSEVEHTLLPHALPQDLRGPLPFQALHITILLFNIFFIPIPKLKRGHKCRRRQFKREKYLRYILKCNHRSDSYLQVLTHGFSLAEGIAYKCSLTSASHTLPLSLSHTLPTLCIHTTPL